MVIQDFVFEIVSRKPGSTFDAEAIGVTAVWGNVVMLRNINMWKSSACAFFWEKLKMSRNQAGGLPELRLLVASWENSNKKIQSKICWNPCLAMDSWTYPRGTDWHEVFPNLGDLDGLTMREQKSRYEASAWGFFPFPGCGKYKLGPTVTYGSFLQICASFHMCSPVTTWIWDGRHFFVHCFCCSTFFGCTVRFFSPHLSTVVSSNHARFALPRDL